MVTCLIAPLNPFPISIPELPREILLLEELLFLFQALSNIFNYPLESIAMKYHSLGLSKVTLTMSKQLTTLFEILQLISIGGSS